MRRDRHKQKDNKKMIDFWPKDYIKIYQDTTNRWEEESTNNNLIENRTVDNIIPPHV